MTGSVRGHCLKAHQAKAWCALHSGHMTKKQRKIEKKNIRRIARSILYNKYGINYGNSSGNHALQRYILQCRPDLKSDGYNLLREFVGLNPINPKNLPQAQTDAFLESYEWRKVRMLVLKRDGARCCCCGATPADGRVMHVDHIKPRKKFPQLALDTNNLQVLCDVCNHGKGNWDDTDWRREFSEETIGAKLRVMVKAKSA